MPYIAIGQSNDPTIYGTGGTEHEAHADAREWIDRENSTHDLTVVRCTYALHHQVMDQGACDYEEIGRMAYTEAEAAAVSDGLDVSEDGVANGSVYLDDADAERLGMSPMVSVLICEGSIRVGYDTANGRSGEIADEPGCPEQQARSYDHALRHVMSAVVGLLEVAVQRDAEIEAEAA